MQTTRLSFPRPLAHFLVPALTQPPELLLADRPVSSSGLWAGEAQIILGVSSSTQLFTKLERVFGKDAKHQQAAASESMQC